MKSKSFNFKKWAKSRCRPAGIYLYRFYDYPIALTLFIHLFSICGNDQIQFL